MMKGSFLRVALAVAMCTAVPGCGDDGEKDGGGTGSPGQSGEVRKEVGEALEATREYLSESGEKLKSALDKRLQSVDEGIAELKKKSAAAGERGREYRDRAISSLEEKKAAARERMDDLRRSGGELSEEAKVKLHAAMKELEEAYEKARKSFENGDQ